MPKTQPGSVPTFKSYIGNNDPKPNSEIPEKENEKSQNQIQFQETSVDLMSASMHSTISTSSTGVTPHIPLESPNKLKKYKQKVLTLGRHKSPSEATSVFHDEMMGMSDEELEPKLLPGEMLICTARNVLRFRPYTEHKQGIYGRLFCTNYRIIFVTTDATVMTTCSSQQNKLIGENDIALNSIALLYHVSKGRRRKLTDTNSLSSHIKKVEIHTKDFRLHAFSFKVASKQDAKTMMMAIVHHAFPTRLELLFAFDLEVTDDMLTEDTSSCTMKMPPLYDQVEHWNEELERLKVVGYRADTFNAGFRTSQSLPQVFVVPSSLSHKDVSDAAEQFIDHRPPIWSYSCRNGASLIRMAYLTLDQAQTHMETKMLDAIQKAHHASDSPTIVDLTVTLFSPKHLQECFEKLRAICCPYTLKDVWFQDQTWYSSLNETHWLGCVSHCLKTAIKVIDLMSKKRKTVIIKELENRDFAPLICSLVQLLLDPHYRTLYGFQCLIQREWVAMGFRFTYRCGLISNSDSECPIFLLFLDCVWQLLQQFPSSFEFSETYLSMLWDSLCLGLFHTFIFNSEQNRYYAQHGFSTGGNKRPSPLLSVWNWKIQYSDEDLTLCRNPLYLTHTHIDLKLQKSRPRHMEYAYRQGGLNASPFSKYIIQRAAAPTDILRPVVKVSILQFWSYFYLRWITSLQIISGGSPARYLQQCLLVEEVLSLQHRIQALQSPHETKKLKRRCSQLIFSHLSMSLDQSDDALMVTPSRQWSENLTSSFPYTPSMTGVSFFGTPLSALLRTSMISSDGTIDDDSVLGDSIDESDSAASSARASGDGNLTASGESETTYI